jgi:hypothetical protein
LEIKTVFKEQPKPIRDIDRIDDEKFKKSCDSAFDFVMSLDSKIQLGQKLVDGDFCKVNLKQANELQMLCVGFELNVSNVCCIMYSGEMLRWHHKPEFKMDTEYTFPDFWQLCINTFKNKYGRRTKR